jgi:serine acetyltransferase
VAPVEVGHGARTGAGAIVTRGNKIPAGETWVGMPAKALGKRSSGPELNVPAVRRPRKTSDKRPKAQAKRKAGGG